MATQKDRFNKLVALAAKALAEGRDPFATDFIMEHNISLDECFTLTEKIAVILRGYLNSDRATQISVLACGVDAGGDQKVFVATARMHAARKRLGGSR